MLHLNLLEKQVRTSTHECVRRGLGVDHRFDMAEPGIEPAQEIKHLAGLRHRVADVAQAVRELLQAHGVLSDAQVTLLERTKLGLVVGGTHELVVAEDAFDVARTVNTVACGL
jgi:hypothetical protein